MPRSTVSWANGALAILPLFTLMGCAGLMFDHHVLPVELDTPMSGSVTYRCASGQGLDVAYGPGSDGILAVDFVVDGAGNHLIAEGTTEGVTRYGFPSDGSHYIWLISAESGTLLWHDGEHGTETARQTGCKPGQG